MSELMKKFYLMLMIFAVSATIATAQNDSKEGKMDMKSDDPVGVKVADGMLYGKDYDRSFTVTEFTDLMKEPSANYDKAVMVKGNVAEVCQSMGCWMTMTEGNNTVRIKTQHEFFLPKDIAGKNAVVSGVFKVTELSEEEARHYLEESKNPTMKPEDIKGPQTAYIIEATGITILD